MCCQCGKAFRCNHSLVKHQKFTLEKGFLHAKIVGNHIGTKPALQLIIKFPVEKSPMSVANVEVYAKI